MPVKVVPPTRLAACDTNPRALPRWRLGFLQSILTTQFLSHHCGEISGDLPIAKRRPRLTGIEAREPITRVYPIAVICR
jgi:hypothetical protein